MSDSPDAPTAHEPSSDDVFLEVIDASAVLDELPDVARAEAWGSSGLSVWREDPDAKALDVEFAAWLATAMAGEVAEAAPARAAAVALSVAALLDLAPATVDAASTLVGDTLAWAPHIGTARPTRAWVVRTRDDISIGVGFVHGDESELSLLADIEDDMVRTLVVAPGPDELFDEAEDLIEPESLDPLDAAQQIVAGWRRSIAAGVPHSESMLVNLPIARNRLGVVLDAGLDDLAEVPAGPDDAGEIDDAERTEFNAWALSVLDGALPGGANPGDVAVPAPLIDIVVPGGTADHPREEREAFAALEWADWLGAVIGLTREGVGADASPQAILDAINRCPEITSTIPKTDRPYFAWAFQHVLMVWRSVGVVDADDRLTADGVVVLPAALRIAWAPT